MDKIHKTSDKKREIMRRYYERHKDRVIERARLYREKNREKVNAASRAKWLENREENIKLNKIRSRRKREEKITILGGKCVVCGETNIHFLHIDCIEGGVHPTGIIYLRANKEKFQVLCANHHYEKTYYSPTLTDARKRRKFFKDISKP